MRTSVKLIVALGLSLLVACERGTKPAAAIGEVNFEDALAEIELPASSYAGDPSAHRARVLVSSRYLLLDGDPHPFARLDAYSDEELARSGLPIDLKRAGDRDPHLGPLAQAILRADEKRADDDPARYDPILIVADAKTPFRVFIELFTTVAAWQRVHTTLAVRGPNGPTTVNVWTAFARIRGCRGIPETSLQVHIREDGIGVRADAGNLATGCQRLGPGLTLPKVGGELDFTALRRCAARLRDRDAIFAKTPYVRLTARPDVPMATVVKAMDALRGANGELFTDIIFWAEPTT